MELHETLAQLRRDHGEATFHDADAFRGALDDYLDEGSASMGTINLLTDAVRLGAVDSMISMLDSGATAESAVDSAGRRLSRDRGSADVVGSQWACAVLGYALGKVPATMVAQLRPDAITAEPPRNEGGTAARPPLSSPAPPHVSPPTHVTPAGPPPGPPAAPPHVSPPSHAPGPAYGSSYPAPPAGYGSPQQPKSRAGLIIGLVVAAVLVLVLGTVGIIALAGGDGDNDAGDDTSSDATSAATSGGTTTDAPTTGTTTDAPTTETAGSLTITGSGYTYELPSDEWQDVTEAVAGQAATIDTVAAWGRSIETARANLLVETSSAFGKTDPAEIKDDWIAIVSESTGAEPREIDPITIGGIEALGIELEWTNANDVDIRQVAYLTIWDGQQYSITMTITQDDSEIDGIYYDILDTWSWT